MPELVADCPRCGVKRMSFDVTQVHHIGREYDWQNWYEAFSICRECRRATTFVLAEDVNRNYRHVHKVGLMGLKDSINRYCTVETYISIKDKYSAAPPEHLTRELDDVFREGATSLSVRCFNAAGTMFRLCVDLATSPLLPEEDEDGLNRKVRRDLGLRLPWLFRAGRLPGDLADLSTCIKEDGNDGAHRGTLSKEDAEDLRDFTFELLKRLYTEPKKLQLARERRDERRNPEGNG